MHMSKGFSLFETLIALSLLSLILLALGKNLTTVMQTAYRLHTTTLAEDSAALSLILMRHALEQAALTSCSRNAPVLEPGADLTTPINHAYGVLTQAHEPPHLLIYSLSKTFWVENTEHPLMLPVAWPRSATRFIVVDDCKQAKIFASNVDPAYLRQTMTPPFSVSLLETKQFFLDPTKEDGVFMRQENDGPIQKIYLHISALTFSLAGETLKLNIHPHLPEGTPDVAYTLTYTPPH